MGEVARHWRARFELTFAADPRDRVSYERTETYGAWIGADSEDQARALLEARITQAEGLARWELVELVEATTGEAEVIAFWWGDGAP
jgi:hypothetical protein